MHLPPGESFEKQILFKHFEPELSSCVCACLPVNAYKSVAQQTSAKESARACVATHSFSINTAMCTRTIVTSQEQLPCLFDTRNKLSQLSFHMTHLQETSVVHN